MVRKRYTELVVSIAKGAPQALPLLDIAIGMGKYTTLAKWSGLVRQVVSIWLRELTYFLKDTVSGWIGDSDRTSEKKQHNRRETPSRTVAKKRTALFISTFFTT